MEKIKKWVFPSTKNNHHPHVLRPLGLSIVLGLILFSNLGYNYTTARQMQVLGYATSISASEVINLSNQQRASSGIAGLTYNAQLTQAAHAKAQDMFAKDYWSHYNPEGQGPAYFIASSGYSYSTGGENLAKDFNTSAGVVNAWMNSAGHRANILQSAYVHTGVAVVDGNFQGTDTTIVVAMYGAPQNTPPPAPAPVATTPTPSTAKPAAPTQSQASPVPTETVQQPTAAPSQVAETPTATTQEQKSTAKSEETTSPITPTGQVNGATSESITMRENLNWAQNSTLVILSSLMLIGVLKHTLVWRTNRRGWRHIWFRSHPAAQYALILVAIVSTLASSAGAIL